MKNRMPTRKSIGKVSTFLAALKRKNRSRSMMRSLSRMTNRYPNSTKIGAGEMVAKRSSNFLPHKKNHRSNEMIIG